MNDFLYGNDYDQIQASVYVQEGPPELQGRTFKIDRDRFTIGRVPSSEVQMVIEKEVISRKHCSIVKRGQNYFIIDHGSSNYTHLNGKKLEPNQEYPLAHNATIQLSNTRKVVMLFLVEGVQRPAPGLGGNQATVIENPPQQAHYDFLDTPYQQPSPWDIPQTPPQGAQIPYPPPQANYPPPNTPFPHSPPPYQNQGYEPPANAMPWESPAPPPYQGQGYGPPANAMPWESPAPPPYQNQGYEPPANAMPWESPAPPPYQNQPYQQPQPPQPQHHVGHRLGCAYCFWTLDPADPDPYLRTFVQAYVQSYQKFFHEKCWRDYCRDMELDPLLGTVINIAPPPALAYGQRLPIVLTGKRGR